MLLNGNKSLFSTRTYDVHKNVSQSFKMVSFLESFSKIRYLRKIKIKVIGTFNKFSYNPGVTPSHLPYFFVRCKELTVLNKKVSLISSLVNY